MASKRERTPTDVDNNFDDFSFVKKRRTNDDDDDKMEGSSKGATRGGIGRKSGRGVDKGKKMTID